MRKPETDPVWESKNTRFDDCYMDLLYALREMPKTTKEERENRRLWFRNHKQYDDFLVDVMKQFRPAAYEKLCGYLGESHAHDNIDSDFGIATMKRKEIDYVVLMEAVYSAVEDYTGVNSQGITYSFLQSVGIKYNHLAEKAAGINDIGLIKPLTQQKGYCRILKLTRKVKEILERTQGNKTLQEAIRDGLQGFSYKFTQKELEEVVRRVNGLDMIGSLDQPIPGGEENNASVREIPETENRIEVWEEENDRRAFWDKFAENFVDRWQEVEAAAGAANRKLLKYFLSKDILLVLKLRAASDAEKEKFKDYLEPKCGQWCHRRNKCPLDVSKKVGSREGCYVRYGSLPGDLETGDSVIYSYLRSCTSSLFETVFDNIYIQSAYPGGVNSLDDMYKKLLKDFKSENEEDRFEFSDAVMARAARIGKSKLSKCRAYYENTTKKELYRLFVS